MKKHNHSLPIAPLFIPGNRNDMFNKVLSFDLTWLIPDLEDSVPEKEKSNARNITNNAIMVNLVGENNTKGPVVYKNLDQLIGIKGVNPHIYGKKETRPNRKMGHITIINSNINEAIKIAREIKQNIKVTST